jgi:hypothetical protein
MRGSAVPNPAAWERSRTGLALHSPHLTLNPPPDGFWLSRRPKSPTPPQQLYRRHVPPHSRVAEITVDMANNVPSAVMSKRSEFFETLRLKQCLELQQSAMMRTEQRAIMERLLTAVAEENSVS